MFTTAAAIKSLTTCHVISVLCDVCKGILAGNELKVGRS